MARYIGNGVTLKLSTASSATSSTGAGAQAVGNLMSISGPETDAPDVDTTVLDTTAYGTQQKGIPMPGGGTMTIAYEQGNAGVNTLIKLARNRTVAAFFVIHPSTVLSQHRFKAYVKGIGREIERDSMITRSVSYSLSSGPNWTT